MNLRIAFFSLLMTASGLASETAYSALRAVCAKHGDDALNRILEVRGGRGTWKVLLADPRVRTGVREIQVANGHILSDGMALVHLRGSGPINVSVLNLDSDGALATVNQQVKQPVPEDLIHYTLSNGTDGSTPIWTVALRHQAAGELSLVQIAANTGAIIAKSLRPGPQNGDIARRGEPIGEEDAESTESADTVHPNGEGGEKSKPRKQVSRSQPALRALPEVAERLAERIESRGRHLREFLPF